MIFLQQPGTIDMRNTMYPSQADLVQDQVFIQPPWSTCYGIVASKRSTLPNGKQAQPGEYFCVTNRSNEPQRINVLGSTAIFTRLGFLGQDLVGGPIESTGRLTYIDGCSDTLLVYPPRAGDPSLSLLHFPAGIDQSFHSHPSIRFGLVIAGSGLSSLPTAENTLDAGTVFCLEEHEIHRFRTLNTSMTIVTYHPDGDWGPTDHNHTMLNRTYVHK
jgi:quercetin dioxygenase-like cupin family protein